MRDFKQQMKAYSDELKNSRYPHSDAEPAAAAIAAVIIIPAAIFMKSGTTGEIASIDIDGEHIYFACNNGCTPEGTLQNFKSIIR